MKFSFNSAKKVQFSYSSLKKGNSISKMRQMLMMPLRPLLRIQILNVVNEE